MLFWKIVFPAAFQVTFQVTDKIILKISVVLHILWLVNSHVILQYINTEFFSLFLKFAYQKKTCPPPPRNVRNRYTVKNGISNLYILLKSALKMQEMPFQRPKFQKISGGHAPGPR